MASSFFVFEEIARTQDGRDNVKTFVAQRNYVVEKNGRISRFAWSGVCSSVVYSVRKEITSMKQK